MRSRSRLPRGVLVATGPVVLVVAGIVGYLSFGYSPWMALAMTLLTLTTVGFASGTHLSTGALVFSAGSPCSVSACSSSSWAWPRPRSWKAG